MVFNRRAAAAALLGFATLACTPAPSATPAAPDAGSQVAQPEYGGRLNLRVGIDIVNFDFHLSSRREMYYTSMGYTGWCGSSPLRIWPITT